MRDIFLFTGYNRIDLLDFFNSKGVNLHALIVPVQEKYISKMTGLISKAIELQIPILNVRTLSNSKTLLPYFKNSYLYSSGYPYLIKPNIFSQFKVALNCHPSLLPRNRGRYIEYILLNDEKESGTTIHQITSGCDDGPIVLQERYPVDFFDRPKSLLKKSYDAELRLLERIFSDETIIRNSKPQDSSLATCYRTQRKPSDSEMSYNNTLYDGYIASRAFDKDLYPGYFMCQGYKVYFHMWVEQENKSND